MNTADHTVLQEDTIELCGCVWRSMFLTCSKEVQCYTDVMRLSKQG